MGDLRRRIDGTDGRRYVGKISDGNPAFGKSPKDVCCALAGLAECHSLFDVRVLLTLVVEYAFYEPPSHVPFPADFDQTVWLNWVDLMVNDDDPEAIESIDGPLSQSDIGRVGATFWDYGDVGCAFVVVWVHPLGQAFGAVFLSQVDERQLNLEKKRIVIGPDMGLRLGANEDPWPNGKPPEPPQIDDEKLLPMNEIPTRATSPPLYRVFLMAGTPNFPTHLRKFTDRGPRNPPYELHGLSNFLNALNPLPAQFVCLWYLPTTTAAPSVALLPPATS